MIIYLAFEAENWGSLFTEESFCKYNKKGDIRYEDIKRRREKIIEFLKDDRCTKIEHVRSFCNAISKDIEFSYPQKEDSDIQQEETQQEEK